MLIPERDYPFVHYPILFHQVQMQGIFSDSKTFADAVPKTEPTLIDGFYLQEKEKEGFSLKIFVEQHFTTPVEYEEKEKSSSKNPVEHISKLWAGLTKPARNDSPYCSLIPVPYPMVVPGGRFREMYYWDTWFTMIGLFESGQIKAVEGLLENFAYLIRTYGFIPNGLRSYFLSRSQPPFFSLMVESLAAHKGDIVWVQFLDVLEEEYRFWMKGERAVKISDNVLVNRYWDDSPTPRPESYREDVELAETTTRSLEEMYRDLRAACESGWDFSSRWLEDAADLSSVRTTRLIPVDLNCLLFHLEKSLARSYQLSGLAEKETHYRHKAMEREKQILQLCWNQETGWFHDYDLDSKGTSPSQTLAGVFPLFMGIATREQALACAKKIASSFLGEGGLVTTLIESGQQWDFPNGWAPLQYISIKGLENYGFTDLAEEVKKRWLNLNNRVFEETGKMMEKYNVADMSVKAGGGEYPNQDGFGWTNGVFLALSKKSE